MMRMFTRRPCLPLRYFFSKKEKTPFDTHNKPSGSPFEAKGSPFETKKSAWSSLFGEQITPSSPFQPRAPKQPHKAEFKPIDPVQPQTKTLIQPDTSIALDTAKSEDNLLQQEEPIQPKVQVEGLNNFLRRVYNTSSFAIGLAITTTYAVILMPGLIPMSEGVAAAGVALSMAGLFGANSMQPTRFEATDASGAKIYETKNSATRLMLYALGCIGLGISGAPVLSALQLASPSVLPIAIGISMSIFGGTSLLSFALPKDSLLVYGRILLGGLLGLISLQLAGLACSHFLGYTALSAAFHAGETYLGIALFTAYIAYDTHLAIKRYEQGDGDHLSVSIQLLLDFWNLMIRIATAIAKSKNQKK